MNNWARTIGFFCIQAGLSSFFIVILSFLATWWPDLSQMEGVFVGGGLLLLLLLLYLTHFNRKENSENSSKAQKIEMIVSLGGFFIMGAIGLLFFPEGRYILYVQNGVSWLSTNNITTTTYLLFILLFFAIWGFKSIQENQPYNANSNVFVFWILGGILIFLSLVNWITSLYIALGLSAIGCCIIITVSDSHQDQMDRNPSANDEQLHENNRIPHLKQNLMKIGLFMIVTLDVFWIGYILGALVAFDQSNTMMGWFILIAGGFATFVFYLSKRWFLSNHNPTCRFGLKWSNLLFLLTTIIGGIILAISLWLKNQLIDTISATNSNIPYLAILIVCLGILLALVTLVLPIHNLANFPGTTPFSRDN